MTSRQWSNLVGALVGIVGLAFVARVTWRQRDAVAETLTNAQPAWLLVAVLVGVLGLSVIGWGWLLLVRALGGDLRLVPAQQGYFVGQLGKYVPGGVWAVVGRGEWARRAGVPGAVAYSSTLLSMATAYAAGSIVAGMAMLLTGSDGAAGWLGLGVVAIGPLGLMGLHPKVFATTARLARRVSGRELRLDIPPWSVSVGIVARQVLAWMGIGTATWLTGVALGMELEWSTVLVATCVAWVAGFLFLPVPGGIGIREAAFVAVLGGSPVAATLALASRLVFIVVDIVGASTTSLLVASLGPDMAGPGRPPQDAAGTSADRREG